VRSKTFSEFSIMDRRVRWYAVCRTADSSSIFSESQMITLKRQIAAAVLALGSVGSASAYDTGKFTCENVGQLAGQTIIAKQSGIPQELYVAILDEKLPGDALVERTIVATIAMIIYRDDLLAVMEPADAYQVFEEDCRRRQSEESGDGQGGSSDGAVEEEHSPGEET
jgi:hypothetical protein